MKVNIVCNEDIGGGLSRDIDVLCWAAEGADVEIFFNGWSARRPGGRLGRLTAGVESRLRKALARVRGAPPFTLNIYLERIWSGFEHRADLNALIPNPEWFGADEFEKLPVIDIVLCKTDQSARIFAELGKEVVDIGFTSVDRRMPSDGDGRERRFLHLAGKSEYKGTGAVVEAWRRHPEWPELVLVQSPDLYWERPNIDFEAPANVQYVREWLDDDELRELQSRSPFHVLPSEAEGYGQVIMEALSCGAVVVTTDAPPMNELVRPDFGFLVEVSDAEPMNHGMRYRVDPHDLDRKIQRLVDLDTLGWQRRAESSRRRFEAERERFRNAFTDFLRRVAPKHPGRK